MAEVAGAAEQRDQLHDDQPERAGAHSNQYVGA
jgi:hypothetical protein